MIEIEYDNREVLDALHGPTMRDIAAAPAEACEDSFQRESLSAPLCSHQTRRLAIRASPTTPRSASACPSLAA